MINVSLCAVFGLLVMEEDPKGEKKCLSTICVEQKKQAARGRGYNVGDTHARVCDLQKKDDILGLCGGRDK